MDKRRRMPRGVAGQHETRYDRVTFEGRFRPCDCERCVIGPREFRWTARITHVPGSGDCHRVVRVRAWGAGKTSQVLQADLLSKSMRSCATDWAFPTSGGIRAIVDYALANGWHRGGRGIWPLTEAAHGDRFELPAFLLTDRMVNDAAPDPTRRVIRAHQDSGEATNRPQR